MNIIDNKFECFVNDIKRQNTKDIFNHILVKYKSLDYNIQNSLEDFLNNYLYWGALKRDLGIYDELYNRAVSLKEHINDYVWLYNKLKDYRSRKVLFGILNNWYDFDFESINNSIERNYLHYFDLDLVKCDKDEIFVDLGAYTGDTVFDYLRCYGVDSYKKIYCYEVTDNSFDILRNNLKFYDNIELRKKAVLDKSGDVYILKSDVDNSANRIDDEGNIAINAVSLDEDIKDKITLIKMDIEGAEYKALEGCKKHIINDNPKLLISLYHNHNDLWRIPKLIDSMYSNYSFYLRCYGSNIFPTEFVLIAIKDND